MVVAGPRQAIDSSLPSKTKPVHQPKENLFPEGLPSKDAYNPDMRELRPAQDSATELKQLKDLARVGKSLKCPPTTIAFVYGTLKRGFGNYWLMEDLMAKGHARFLGTARTKQKFPMVCGPYQVPFLLDIPASGHHVCGELYEVDRLAIECLDDLEGVAKGHYVRRPVVLSELQLHPSSELGFTFPEVLAQAYFADPSYTPRLAQAPHIEAFTEKESATYVRRKDRPQNRTFLEQIKHWIEAQEVARRN